MGSIDAQTWLFAFRKVEIITEHAAVSGLLRSTLGLSPLANTLEFMFTMMINVGLPMSRKPKAVHERCSRR
jgi:hypothetical protein